MSKQFKDDVIKNDLIVKSLIKEIWECNTSIEDLNELNLLIARQMLMHKTAIDNLEKHIREMDKSSQRDSMQEELNGYRHQHEINSISLRKANASSQKLIASKARERLFMDSNSDDSSSNLRNRSSKLNKEILSKQSISITDNLKSVSRMLAEQVSQSEQTLHSLIDSSATATETQEEFKTMGNVINYSKKILTKYGRREITDKVLIFLALAFFFACVLYVVMKRLF